jgi:hypothetical protein
LVEAVEVVEALRWQSCWQLERLDAPNSAIQVNGLHKQFQRITIMITLTDKLI